MSNHHKGHLIAILYLFTFTSIKAQTTNKLSSNDGIWEDYGVTVNAKNYPEFHGRLVNVYWSDIETSPNYWSWTVFDSDVNQHITDTLPVIILIYTGPNAPDWIYSSGGVAKVNATDSAGNFIAYSPYYLDSNYNNYFKRMITNVRQHIQSYPSSTRNLITAVQGCYGSTGDPIAYKGIVPAQYQINPTQFDSLFKVYSLYYYNEYKTLSPPIRLLSNPDVTDSTQTYWLLNNCAGGWLKCGTFAKGSQINLELDKQSWLYNILNQPQNGEYVMARSEVDGQQLYAGWWVKNHYKEMFGIMCYCIYWGLDWPNESSTFIINHNYDSAFAFFNKYAGQKIPGLATNAMCALKDALDAADSIRFPSATYGAPVSHFNLTRINNIYNTYSSYGAKLEDSKAVTGNEISCLGANGTNDVGWHLLPGNYERYLHQINANATSAGYWNVDAADTITMYGRYARGFDMANKKNALYFDVDDNFLRNAPLSGAYPVTVEITYFDSGYGCWRLFYDAVGNNNKYSIKVSCTNTNTWLKAHTTLTDANFGNGSLNNSDFYIQNMGYQNVIFSLIEISRSQQTDTAFITTNINFDTVCVNSVISPNPFVLHATALNGSSVKIGPFNNCSFSTSATGNFTNVLYLNNYGNTINQTIYVKLNTANVGNWSGNIPISGGGKNTAYASLQGSVLNSSPLLNAVVTAISCYNKKDGLIDLQPTGGMDSLTFAYKWTNDLQLMWNATTQDICNLQPANYTVMINSDYGCSTSKTFAITQPQVLITNVTQDSSIVCKGSSTTVTVSATGGSVPYTGTGTFQQYAGYTSYSVNDIHGCSNAKGITVSNGSLTAPVKPTGINGPTSISSFQTNILFSIINPNYSNIYTWSVPSDATITSGQGTPSVTVTWGSTPGSVSVYAGNVCGNSASYILKVKLAGSLTDSSDIVMLNATAAQLLANNTISLIPNPVKDIATVKFFTATSEAYSIVISDVNGKLLSSKKNISLPGSNLQKLDVARFSAGIYFITLIEETGIRRTIQMIKQ